MRTKYLAVFVALVVIGALTILAATALADVSMPQTPADWQRAVAEARDIQKLLAWAIVALVGGLVALVGAFLRILVGMGQRLVDALNSAAASMQYCRKHSGMEDAG